MSNIDLSYLEEITGGDKEVMGEMIGLFLEDTPEHIERLQKLYESKSWEKLSAEAHKLKPTLLYIGLADLNEKALELENIGREERNLDKIPELIGAINQGFKDVLGELEKIKEELS